MGRARSPLHLILAKPRGFCAGVERAIEIVERALDQQGGKPVYVRHEIVHNRAVVDDLRRKGAVFVEDVGDIPPGALTVFSAHGVSRSVEAAARARSLDVIDATCPLVQKVHRHGQRYAALGYDVILIGHRGHPEVEGTRGQISGRVHVVGSADDVLALAIQDPTRVAYVTQTTLSVSDTRDVITALRNRFPAIEGPDTRDICYATQNRQAAVRALTHRVQLLLVVGSANSSNSTRLREIGQTEGVPSYLVDGPKMIERQWLDGVGTIGITAGASAPEYLVQEVITWLTAYRPTSIEILDGIEETVQFRLPPRLVATGGGAAAS